MADIEVEDLFNYPPLSYTRNYIDGAFGQLPDMASLESQASVETATMMYLKSHNDIEELYTGLHRGVEQVAARLSAHTPPQLDHIREHNRQLIGKIRSLDRAITENVASVRSGSSSRSSPHSGPSTSDAELSRSETNKERGQISKDSKLAKKLLLVGNQKTKSQLAEFKTRLEAPEFYVAPSNNGHISFGSQITDTPQFLRVIMNLGMAIENSSFGEQSSRIKKRIALAQFYKAYSLAQSQPEIFLSWCGSKEGARKLFSSQGWI
ncbi:uncharacterized protein N7483_008843 [Penicillium malachiteum]|uniref:uncharacterized protein n=1 Tax=Penicillium malachiteum TaxID=1324776 RepID=UPI002549A140|nr:uncharacterized protein N7483_008843 [Penicillium malachiteum]KAJ5720909.1 hypothetical protein N7483_008843 [Penicillium malachiteum]